MPTIVCELCGSRDIVKENGEYICRGCGAKYSTEEAKHLITEPEEPTGASEEPGTDPSREESQAEALLSTAEALFKKGDYSHALDLYDQAATLVPEDWRVIFFTACCKACTCKTSEIPSRLNTLAEYSRDIPPLIFTQLLDLDVALPTCIEYFFHWFTVNKRMIGLLRSVWRATHSDEAQKMYLDTALKSYGLQVSLAENWLNNPVLKEVTNIPSFVTPLIKLVREIYDELNTLFEDTFTNRLPNIVDKALLKEMLETWTETFLFTNALYPFIRETEPGYVHPIETQIRERMRYLDEHPELLPKAQSGGCYVATAVYGSYDCPAVWTLRRFRDDTLARTCCGRAFIRVYYAISPTLVKWFGHTRWFRALWKPGLDRMVEKLNARGVKNTPYADRPW